MIRFSYEKSCLKYFLTNQLDLPAMLKKYFVIPNIFKMIYKFYRSFSVFLAKAIQFTNIFGKISLFFGSIKNLLP